MLPTLRLLVLLQLTAAQAISFDWVVPAGVYPASGFEQGVLITPDGTGGIIVSGRFGPSAATFGTTTLTSTNGGRDLFAAHIDSTGSYTWVAQASSSWSNCYTTPTSIVSDGAGGAVRRHTLRPAMLTWTRAPP